MSERAPRLGDVVDDYCPRCRLLLNHDVAALLDGQVAKVTCRTCYNTHDYRHAQEPARRKPAARRPNKQALMEQVLAGLGRPPVAPGAPAPAAEPAPAAPQPSAPPPPSAATLPGAATTPSPEPSAAAPGQRKRRDLWAELERIRGQKRE